MVTKREEFVKVTLSNKKNLTVFLYYFYFKRQILDINNNNSIMAIFSWLEAINNNETIVI